MYKNAFSCAIPGTQELGCNMAAALGALGGDWTLGLEVLKNITAAHVAEAKTLQIPMDIKADETKEGIYTLRKSGQAKGSAFAALRTSMRISFLLQKMIPFSFRQSRQRRRNSSMPLILKQLPLRIWWIMQKPFPSQNCPV